LLRVSPNPLGIAHHIDHAGEPRQAEDGEAQHYALGEWDACGVGSDDGGKRINRRTEHADARAKQDDRHGRDSVIAGRDHDRQKQHVKGKCLLGHAVGGAAEGKDRHQHRDHPFLATLERPHRTGNAGIYGAARRNDADKATDHQHEQSYIDCIGLVRDRIVEAGDRGHDDVEDTLRIGFGNLVGAGNRNVAIECNVMNALILTGGNDPGQRRDENDQPEKNGEGSGEA
jgi:hypothetical protein